MINQTAISARIHNYTLWQINQEVMTGRITRNRILNDGARLWLHLNDARDAYRAHEDPITRKKILNGFLKQWFPEAATW